MFSVNSILFLVLSFFLCTGLTLVSFFFFFRLVFPLYCSSYFPLRTMLDLSLNMPTINSFLFWPGQDGLVGGSAPWGRSGGARRGVG